MANPNKIANTLEQIVTKRSYMYPSIHSYDIQIFSNKIQVSPRDLNVYLQAFVNYYEALRSDCEGELDFTLDEFNDGFALFVNNYISNKDVSIPFSNRKRYIRYFQAPPVIGQMSFIDCSIESVDGSDVFIINENSFWGCNINSMTLVLDEDSYIYYNAFSRCKIKKLILIVNNLNGHIHQSAFDGIKSIDELIIKSRDLHDPNFQARMKKLTDNKNIRHIEYQSIDQLTEAVPQDLMKAYKEPIVNMMSSDYRIDGFNKGDHVLFGGYQWWVVDTDYTSALLLLDSALRMNYNPNGVVTSYEDSEIRKELNSTFYASLKEDGLKVLISSIESHESINSSSFKILHDKIYLASCADHKKVKKYLNKNKAYITRDLNEDKKMYLMTIEASDGYMRDQLYSDYFYPLIMMRVQNKPNYSSSYFSKNSIKAGDKELSKIDYDKSNYTEISQKDALKQYKEDPTKLRIIIDNKIIIFNQDGKVDEYFRHRAAPVSRPELMNITNKKTGESWFDAKIYSPKQLFSLADKIYVAEEFGNSKINDDRWYGSEEFYKIPSEDELISLMQWFILRQYPKLSKSFTSAMVNLYEYIESCLRNPAFIAYEYKNFDLFKSKILTYGRSAPAAQEKIFKDFLDFVLYYLKHYNELYPYVSKRSYYIDLLDQINTLSNRYNELLYEFNKYASQDTRLAEIKNLKNQLETLQSEIFIKSKNKMTGSSIGSYIDHLYHIDSYTKKAQEYENILKQFKIESDKILQRYKDGSLF